MDRHVGRSAADRDLHQYRLDAIVAEAVRTSALVQQQVLRSKLYLDDLVAPNRADRQHTLQDEEMLDDLVRMAGGKLPDRLVDQAEGEMLRLQGRRIADLGRAASADIAELGAAEVRERTGSREGIPVERLFGKEAHVGAHFVGQRARLDQVIRHVSSSF